MRQLLPANVSFSRKSASYKYAQSRRRARAGRKKEGDAKQARGNREQQRVEKERDQQKVESRERGQLAKRKRDKSKHSSERRLIRVVDCFVHF